MQAHRCLKKFGRGRMEEREKGSLSQGELKRSASKRTCDHLSGRKGEKRPNDKRVRKRRQVLNPKYKEIWGCSRCSFSKIEGKKRSGCQKRQNGTTMKKY